MREVEMSGFNIHVPEGDVEPTYSAKISEDGVELDIDFEGLTALAYGYERICRLYYMVVNQEQNTSMQVPLDVISSTDNSVKFDLKPVLDTYIKEPAIVTNHEILIEKYSYESSMKTDYGSKVISVPYSVTTFTDLKNPESTDGVYVFSVADYQTWNDITIYVKGESVISEGVVYKSLVNYNSESLDNEDYWEKPDEYALAVLPDNNSGVNMKLGINILITRYVKKNYMLKLLLKTSFKSYDDQSSFAAFQKVKKLREMCLRYILDNNPVAADYHLKIIPIEFTSSVDFRGIDQVKLVGSTVKTSFTL